MASTESSKAPSLLTLGWQVNTKLDPLYLLDGEAKPGLPTNEMLVRVPAGAAGAHTAIIAQSGSGKSFFLGRYIEELLINTKARCVILDPNADFRRVHEVEDAGLWTDAARRKGKLTHEVSRGDFESLWSNISVKIRTGVELPGKNYEKLQLEWRSLSVEFLAEDVAPMQRSDLYHCDSFVKDLGRLLNLKCWASGNATDIFDEAQKLFQWARLLPEADFRLRLEEIFTVSSLIKAKPNEKEGKSSPLSSFDLSMVPRAFIERFVKGLVERFIERSVSITKYVSPEIERFYFGKAREYQAAGILKTQAETPSWSPADTERLMVVDLPSLREKNTRLLAINSVLTSVWDTARNEWEGALKKQAKDDTRVPTFIVVDEAHNLIPADTRGNKAEAILREQFRTIVAEGRKYGLFLVLVSQRPDKLDPLVLSECENRAVMKLGSASVLDITRRMLGLDDIAPKMLEKSLDFEIGRALLVGRWMPDGPQIIYCGARRTMEGGRNLRSAHWAIPDQMTTPAGNSKAALPESPAAATKVSRKAATKVTSKAASKRSTKSRKSKAPRG